MGLFASPLAFTRKKFPLGPLAPRTERRQAQLHCGERARVRGDFSRRRRRIALLNYRPAIYRFRYACASWP